jgi:GTP-binding protein
MIIRSASFVGSFVKEEDCPKGDLSEFAFIGRSNVGKSSLINMLCHRKDLVKISRSPGKTQTLNFFLINEQFYIVDLPGYGYARVSKEMRKKWEIMIREYLVSRKSLQCIFQLIDSRLEPQQIDLNFTNQLGEWQVPFALVFTKTDKLSKAQTWEHIHEYHDMLRKTWEVIPETFVTSATTAAGKEELLGFMEHILEHRK